MTEAIIVACITAGASVLCQMLIGKRTREQAARANAETSKLMIYRLEELEKKVMKHNNLVERMAVVERDLKTAFHYIDDMKGERS